MTPRFLVPPDCQKGMLLGAICGIAFGHWLWPKIRGWLWKT